jgi:hypothetical protein
MQSQSTSASPADSTQQIPAPSQTPAPTLEQTRERVKSALHSAEEDGDMSSATFANIARPLVLALRDLDELTMF